VAETSLPPALRRRTDRESIAEDIEPYLGTSIEERSMILSALCKFASEVTDQSPLRRRILEFEEARSPESLELWSRLMQRSRKA
jgi:hypothetical protein